MGSGRYTIRFAYNISASWAGTRNGRRDVRAYQFLIFSFSNCMSVTLHRDNAVYLHCQDCAELRGLDDIFISNVLIFSLSYLLYASSSRKVEQRLAIGLSLL